MFDRQWCKVPSRSKLTTVRGVGGGVGAGVGWGVGDGVGAEVVGADCAAKKELVEPEKMEFEFGLKELVEPTLGRRVPKSRTPEAGAVDVGGGSRAPEVTNVDVRGRSPNGKPKGEPGGDELKEGNREPV